MDEFRSRSCLHLYKRLYHQVQREWRPTGFKAFGNHQTNLHHTKVNISCFSLTEKMLIIHKWMLFCFVPCDVEICDDNWPNRMSVWTVTLKHSLWKKTSTWTGLLIHFAQAALHHKKSHYLPVTQQQTPEKRTLLISGAGLAWPFNVNEPPTSVLRRPSPWSARQK